MRYFCKKGYQRTLESERIKLNNGENKYLSIEITQAGVPRTTIEISRETTAHAFNMKTPNVYISPENLRDEGIMKQLESYNVIGCYIWTPLSDYGFLTRFKKLQDINIKNGAGSCQ